MSTKEEREESYIQKKMTTCLHFRGIQNDPCAAGVSIRALVGGDDFGWARKIPCIRTDEPDVPCEKLSLPNREEAIRMVADDKASTERHMRAFVAAHDDAKKKGLRRGNGGTSSMPCPLECGGTLQYSVADVNGHMHARCDSGNCVSWME